MHMPAGKFWVTFSYLAKYIYIYNRRQTKQQNLTRLKQHTANNDATFYKHPPKKL